MHGASQTYDNITMRSGARLQVVCHCIRLELGQGGVDVGLQPGRQLAGAGGRAGTAPPQHAAATARGGRVGQKLQGLLQPGAGQCVLAGLQRAVGQAALQPPRGAGAGACRS